MPTTPIKQSEIEAVLGKISSTLGISLAITKPYIYIEEIRKHFLESLQRYENIKYIYESGERRLDVRKIFPWAKSIIMGIKNYANYLPKETDSRKGFIGFVSRYVFALGADYHKVLKDIGEQVIASIKKEMKREDIQYKVFVDSSPIYEKGFAVQSGLGFLGYNTMLITKDFGSWVYIFEIITDIEVLWEEKGNILETCKQCGLCISSCPTKALEGPFILYPNKCISYLTVEYKGEVGEDIAKKNTFWVYGCDICQEVCPHNSEFPATYSRPMVNINLWEEFLVQNKFKSVFKNTPILRTGKKALHRNISIIKKKLLEL